MGTNPGLGDKFKKVGLSDREVRTGHVYQIPDKEVHFPETQQEREKGRGVHRTRYAIVVQNDETVGDPTYTRVLIVPTSESSLSRKVKPRYGIYLKCGDGNLPSECLGLVDHIQPILKTDLTNYCGELKPSSFEEIQATLFKILGFIK